jgi:hypothetical protein
VVELKKLLLAILLVIAVVFLLGSSGQEQKLEEPPIPESLGLLPEEVQSFKLIKKASGEDAIKEIKRLHPKNFGIIDGYVGEYTDLKGSKIQVWISVSESEEKAEELLYLMNENMANSNIFSNQRVEDINGKTVHRVDGMGMDHYYYNQGGMVVWIASDYGVPKEVLEAFISYLNRQK